MRTTRTSPANFKKGNKAPKTHLRIHQQKEYAKENTKTAPQDIRQARQEVQGSFGERLLRQVQSEHQHHPHERQEHVQREEKPTDLKRTSEMVRIIIYPG